MYKYIYVTKEHVFIANLVVLLNVQILIPPAHHPFMYVTLSGLRGGLAIKRTW